MFLISETGQFIMQSDACGLAAVGTLELDPKIQLNLEYGERVSIPFPRTRDGG